MATKSREKTKEHIIDTLQKLILKQGFKGIDISQVAKMANVNRNLIYRYFQGIPNLYSALAKKSAIWISTEKLIERCITPDTPYFVIYRRVLIEVAESLRKNPMIQEVLKWELIEKNEITEAMSRVREKQNHDLLEALQITLEKPSGVDRLAYAALINGGLAYLALRSKNTPKYGGMDFSREEDWDRIKAVVSEIMKMADAKYDLGSTPAKND